MPSAGLALSSSFHVRGSCARPRTKAGEAKTLPRGALSAGGQGRTRRTGQIMKSARRKFLHLAACTAALPAATRFARALDYPTRPVHLIEGFGAGGTPDIVARLIGHSLSDRLRQSFVIENRSGASGNIATEAVARASPDGHTLLLITVVNVLNTTLFKLSFDFARDIAPVASIGRVPFVMEVNPSVPAKTVAEFIAYCKA